VGRRSDLIRRRAELVAMSDVTQVLQKIERGDPEATERLLPLVYDELKRMAASKMFDERPDHTLQTTALVHEAYLRPVPRQCADDVLSGVAFGWNHHSPLFPLSAQRIVCRSAPYLRCPLERSFWLPWKSLKSGNSPTV